MEYKIYFYYQTPSRRVVWCVHMLLEHASLYIGMIEMSVIFFPYRLFSFFLLSSEGAFVAERGAEQSFECAYSQTRSLNTQF